MIPLRIPINPLPISEPVVLRLRAGREDDAKQNDHDAFLIAQEKGTAIFDLCGLSLNIHVDDAKDLDGDVLLILPGRKIAERLIRAASPHNTFLVTEQCDQLCVMCSQPPKKHHIDLFQQFFEAALLAPQGAWIGISGGEPLLHKQGLFEFISNVHETRPDIGFHILTNAQHFDESDGALLATDAFSNVLWGIPVYSEDAALHDRIVGKEGAFLALKTGLGILARSGASIELRTVVLRSNVSAMANLALFVCLKTPFIQVWAIMQLENIGFGRMNWDKEFCDTSLEFQPLGAAIDIVQARGINVSLYNFPACTVPQTYRQLAVRSISDWKQKYLDICENCPIIDSCGGFFEWYPEDRGFLALGHP